ncbi:putative protein of unknown function (DUF1349) [Lyophyllum shimeji]|uniref:Uncharacterized protein n=1 Tax=Lyophyllum shimeji TaxID=47721 RepID=A0A9P3US01_LYOSH|nr:putative protein of unknown function (DUF1349) [Lyophyllum shimeji]
MRLNLALAVALTIATMSSAATDTSPPKLRPHNTSQNPPVSFPFAFTIAPNTDLWLKPAPINGPLTSLPLISTSQPTFYTALPLASFVRASVTVSFLPQILYDQAGLVLLFPRDTSKWIKGGLEYVDGQAKRSVVVTTGRGKGADWSVAPPVPGSMDPAGRVRTVVEFEREEDGTGTSLFVKIGGEVVREVTWVFAAPGDPKEELWIGFYGARPAKPDVAGDFTVSVENGEKLGNRWM